ncbi:hypothetical protein PRIPAC_78569 [Pristionchus pacificus]|uniref:Uncharacterized protein n=1 Tax=Pristionchus pacificus TaxID=54126 RepID=A0A2A6CL03_PRIPA|nr:hypothetical protein PRIPAC_78569 [Pristionchus pacificus]|eukprot:PDM78894.1 hypothetical protein PRIPAC_31473 [Pristionchus pacificus]
MKESTYDLLCAVMLGFGNFCLFLGYDTQNTIAEPVLRSVHDRSPDRIDMHAGYNGTAVCTVVFMLFSLAVPWTLGRLGSKGSIVFGSSLFTAYLCSFLYVHYIPYYVSAAANGVGYALFSSGVGAYTTEHSTARTIGRNSALSYSLATSGLVVGGLAIFNTSQRLMYGSFVALGIVSNIIFALMPPRAVEKSLAQVNDSTRRIRLSSTLTFWMSIYAATLIYSKRLSNHDNLQAYYISAVGVGEILMGAIVSLASKRFRDFAKMTTQSIGTALFVLAMVLAFLSTPFDASHSPTDDETLLIQPSMEVALLIALLLGMADCALVSSRTVLCSLLMPEKIPQVFSISKFYQPLASSVILFLSSFISMPMHFALNLAFGTIALYAYHRSMSIASRREGA